jgi:hypothetical protein
VTDRRGWTGELVEIAEVIGDLATIKLIDAFGGIRLSIPKHVPDRPHRIEFAIGREAMLKLIERFGGDRFDLPTLRALRSAKVAILESTAGTQTTALRHRVTDRYVRKVRATVKEPLPLFDAGKPGRN